MHKSAKPVRKCHNCDLNLGQRCGLFADPHKQWQSGKCRGYLNPELYQQYLANRDRRLEKGQAAERRERAKKARTEPHHDGTLAHRTPLVDRHRSP